MSVLTLNNPFFKTIGDTITEELKAAGYETVVVAGEEDVAIQQRQVNDFLVSKAAAIVLCPCDSKAIGPVIQKANEAGVPVFTADIACLAPEAKVVSHIATDNLGGGRLAGEAMINFGPLGVLPAFLIYGMLLAGLHRFVVGLDPADARVLLAPFAVLLEIVLLASDLDNALWFTCKVAALPALVVYLGTRHPASFRGLARVPVR